MKNFLNHGSRNAPAHEHLVNDFNPYHAIQAPKPIGIPIKISPRTSELGKPKFSSMRLNDLTNHFFKCSIDFSDSLVKTMLVADLLSMSPSGKAKPADKY